MSIDTSGEFWVGSDADDIDDYLRAYTADNNPVDTIVHARCPCGHDRFQLFVDPNESVAERVCASCRANHRICDSDEHWDDAEAELVQCACDHTTFEVAVGFSHRDDGSVNWITVAERCVACGVLGSAVDWKVDYDPTDHLYAVS